MLAEHVGDCCPDFECLAVNVVLQRPSSPADGKINEERAVSTFRFNNHHEDGDATCTYVYTELHTLCL